MNLSIRHLLFSKNIFNSFLTVAFLGVFFPPVYFCLYSDYSDFLERFSKGSSQSYLFSSKQDFNLKELEVSSKNIWVSNILKIEEFSPNPDRQAIECELVLCEHDIVIINFILRFASLSSILCQYMNSLFINNHFIPSHITT